MPEPSPSFTMIMRPGGKVKLGPEGEIDAVINTVSISGENLTIRYEVCWWSGNDRKEQWVEAHEVRDCLDAPFEPIGFHQCKNPLTSEHSPTLKNILTEGSI